MGNGRPETLEDLAADPAFYKLSPSEQHRVAENFLRDLKTAKILVIDALPESAELCWRVLKEKGYQAWYACDERSALAAFREQRPDLLLLGMTGSGLDALGLLGCLRAEPKTAGVKVMVTGVATMHWEQAQRIGAEDFVEVPFNLKVLLEKVARVLGV